MLETDPSQPAVRLPEKVDGAAVLLAHADRCWKAAEVNAARIAARANLVLSGVTAMLGLKLFVAGREFETVLASPYGAWFWLFWIATGFALVFLVLALVTVLFGPRRPGQASEAGDSANAGLLLHQGAIDRPWAVPASYATVYVFLLTYRASVDLHERNRKREQSVEKAQKQLLVGVLALLMAIVFYTPIAWEKLRDEKAESIGEPKSQPAAVDRDAPGLRGIAHGDSLWIG